MAVTLNLIELTAADGYVLGATRYVPDVPPHACLVVAGATAVPQGFYKRFAEFATSRGFEVLTFDYRGIGRSHPGSLKNFRMDLLDWGRLDLAAAVDAMAHPQVPLFIVGHSFGGHAFGLLPNHQKVAGFYVFGTGAGWHGYMPMGERVRVLAMWHLVLPVLTWWKGYCPWKMLGMGEDLPVDVYRQWRHWCRFPRYFFDDPAMSGIESNFADVRTPIVAANALDDRWAMPASRDAFVEAYRNAPLTCKDLNPSQSGGALGHMGYFRQSATSHWEDALEWFTGLSHRAERR
ncbi:alpha/beta fold hydrolase [Pantoea sp. Bo_2]|uniref:alpha/beta hydrolase family protein n=1 Tax=Gammaproteobacteria TaxID=1236 RepID=UPI0002D40BE8|nr:MULTISPECIES: alpha/beta fold hydrolase [Gammaproteobacteria]KAA5983181.1 alpha/beta fold hydrolase [Pantoea sp. M_3]KAA6014522.1 alpha/beta fold hydrolase [Pantoea sp. F_18]KAA6016828.1 alpha/beta fold hydrolase [Pantoea sp. F_5]KAA6019239.1 alpha/beta fold hydrolase [Pantoea sp. F_15]KAA6029221.1 alpha/beta fold hydrolase [Pantoea sp. F_12]KAA6036093.1 alpha/beta fold hydrolase [Pantoea sp. F_16]KAA6039719.1 alpha/beta fold hydrolase [Pantoea sp. F_11]KAA6092405.1 alpha/beta fold hydro